MGRGDDDGRLFHGSGLTFDLERDEAAEEEGEIHERTHESDVKSVTPAWKRTGNDKCRLNENAIKTGVAHMFHIFFLRSMLPGPS